MCKFTLQHHLLRSPSIKSLLPSYCWATNYQSFTKSSCLKSSLFHHQPRPVSPSPFPASQGTTHSIRAVRSFFLSFMMQSTSSLSPAQQVVDENNAGLLDAKDDDYGGVLVEMKGAMNSERFASLLRASVSQWRQEGKSGVWIKMPIGLANLVEAAVKEGFYYHHAEPDYLMLVHWIPEAANTLPANASHRVGIGAFVINSERKVLVVQERSGKFRGSGVWKLPTGVVNQGEDICDAAAREVKEETGIDTEFLEVLAFSQSHQVPSIFGKSDLFFVCMLRPLSLEIQKQVSEIEAAQWMPLEEYTSQPFVQKHEHFKYIADICAAKLDKEYTGFNFVPTERRSGKMTYVYCNKKAL